MKHTDTRMVELKDTLFIINPISGNGRKKRIEKMLRRYGCRIAYTSYAGHAEEIAAAASVRCIVAVGGDGTVNEVARGLIRAQAEGSTECSTAAGKCCKSMGIIPCGSGDGLARCLGISRNPHKALRQIQKGCEKALDCGILDCGKLDSQVENPSAIHPFVSVCGMGLDAIVAERFAKSGKRGLLTYIKQAIKIWRTFKPEHYRIDIDGKIVESDAVLITVANSNQWGNGARIAPNASPFDGLLDISIVDMFKTIEIPLLAMQLMTGRIDRNRHLHSYRGCHIRIERSHDGPAHFDGDWTEAGRVLNIRVIPGSVRVRYVRKKS